MFRNKNSNILHFSQIYLEKETSVDYTNRQEAEVTYMSIPTKHPSFRIRLSKEDLNILLQIVFFEVTYQKKQQDVKQMKFPLQQYQKRSKKLLQIYSEPMQKEYKMIPHTLDSLDMILRMMEVHIFNTLKDQHSLKLYQRLCKIYSKRKREMGLSLQKGQA